MPPPAASERYAMRVPSGENTGAYSSSGALVMRVGSPPATCCTHRSRLPSPDRTDAYAMSRPSGERAGSLVSPESNVSRFNGASGFEVAAARGRSQTTAATQHKNAAAATQGQRGRRFNCRTGCTPDSDSSLRSSSAIRTSSIC